MKLSIIDLPKVRYNDAWNLQKNLHSLKVEDKISDTLILLEHYPVITLGKFGKESNILKTKEELSFLGIECYQVERGGDVTYHGPGQLVGYLIFKIDGVKNFVLKIENTLIKLLENYGIRASIDPKNPGVWIENRKIAAIGITIKRRVSFHGFALNINNNLTPFSYIVPCGLKDKKVTSMKEETHLPLSIEDIKEKISKLFTTEFGFQEYKIFKFSSYMEDSILASLLEDL